MKPTTHIDAETAAFLRDVVSKPSDTPLRPVPVPLMDDATHKRLLAAFDKQPAQPRQGYRTFICDECQHTWEEATRDAYSPSGETCPQCREGYVQPSSCRLDPTLPVDDFGNLL